jgi:hypothetical protein
MVGQKCIMLALSQLCCLINCLLLVFCLGKFEVLQFNMNTILVHLEFRILVCVIEENEKSLVCEEVV